MMATTALDVLLEDLKVSARDARLTRLLLGSTPLAAAGQETMVPLVDVATSIAGGRMHVQRALSRFIGTMHRMDVPLASKEDTTTFCFTVLSSAAMVNGSSFVQYTINPSFLTVLNAVKNAYRLKALF